MHGSVAELQFVVIQPCPLTPEYQRDIGPCRRRLYRADGGFPRQKLLQRDAPATRRAAQHQSAIGDGFFQGGKDGGIEH